MATITVAPKTWKIKFSSKTQELSSDGKPCSQQSNDRSWSSCSLLGDNSYACSPSNKRARPNPKQCQKEMKIKMDRSVSQQCSTIVKSLIHEPEGWVFKEPVDPIKLGIPDYFTIIKKPMDLSTVKSKLDNNRYKTTEEFVADVRLTFSNATLYNPPNNFVHQMAKRLSEVFESCWDSLTETLCSRSKLPTVVAEEINAQEQRGPKTPVHKSLSFKRSRKSSKPKAAGRLIISQPKGLGLKSKKKDPVEEIKCDPSISFSLDDSKTKCDVNPKVARSDQESDVSALTEEIGSSTAACIVTPEASSRKDLKSPCCETPLSPTKSLRAAMLKQRFAETIFKAQQKTLNSDSDKIRLEKERLEKKQQEERARIEAEIKAAEAATRKKDEIDMKNKREREREAARAALQKVGETAGIERNVEIVMELETLSGGPLVYSPRGAARGDMDCPLKRLGLVFKYDSCDDMEDASIDCEEGEILL